MPALCAAVPHSSASVTAAGSIVMRNRGSHLCQVNAVRLHSAAGSSEISNADWDVCRSRNRLFLADLSPTAPRRSLTRGAPNVCSGSGVRPRIFQQGTHHRRSRFQPLAGAPGCARHSPVYRHGLRLLGVLAAAVQGDRHHRQRGLSEGPRHSRPDLRHHLRLEDLHAGVDLHAVLRVPRLLPPPSWAAGWSASVRARPASWRRSAGAEDW